jgi:Protein of unknown function (DUF1203)
MQFQIQALPAHEFAAFFGASDEVLAERGVMRVVTDKSPGFPCRVSLRDASVGETLLLLNYEHQKAATPYRASHAIFVREHASQDQLAEGEIPLLFRHRLMSIRAFSDAGLMLDADVVEGVELEKPIAAMLENPEVGYLHLHYAKPGCYAARVNRATPCTPAKP